MDSHVAGEERQAVGQLENPLVQGAALPQSGAAQRRLMDQLQRQAWSHMLGALPGPAAHQVPGPQAQQLGDEEPDAGQVSHGLVGEKLSHPALDAPGITGDGLGALAVGPHLDRGLRARAIAVEFFFEGRTPR